MLNTAKGGWTPHRKDSSEENYRAQLKQAKAQADGNPYVAGIQAYLEVGGPGYSTKGSTTAAYADQPLKTNELIQSNFSQKSSAGNMASAESTTGNLEGQTSMTKNPNRDPEELMSGLNDDSLAARMEMYMKAQSNADFGNNDRSQTMRLG